MTTSLACTPERATGYHRKQLVAAFAQVRNPVDWKGPISAVIAVAERPLVEQAVIWFTATVPAFTPARGAADRLVVRAPGYSAGPAGPGHSAGPAAGRPSWQDWPLSSPGCGKRPDPATERGQATNAARETGMAWYLVEIWVVAGARCWNTHSMSATAGSVDEARESVAACLGLDPEHWQGEDSLLALVVRSARLAAGALHKAPSRRQRAPWADGGTIDRAPAPEDDLDAWVRHVECLARPVEAPPCG